MLEEAAFYRKQAEVQRSAAEKSGLANVRERCLTAAANWDRIAERSEACARRRSNRAAEAIPA